MSVSGTKIYTLEGVRHAYGGQPVLDIDRLDVRAGEISRWWAERRRQADAPPVAEFPGDAVSRHLRYNGQACNGSVPLEIRRQVTMVFQRPLLQRFSVRANVVYGLLRGSRPTGRRRKQGRVD
jgi:tungstate transport system ATP-binding protein